jgi:hypothetical protein
VSSTRPWASSPVLRVWLVTDVRETARPPVTAPISAQSNPIIPNNTAKPPERVAVPDI